MENILIVLPTEWKLNKIRYLQGNVDEPLLVDMDLLDSPLDNPFSWLNYERKVVKQNGPTGFKLS